MGGGGHSGWTFDSSNGRFIVHLFYIFQGTNKDACMQSLIFQTPSPDKKGDGGCTCLVLIKRAAHSPLPKRSTISVCLAPPPLAPSQHSSFPSERDLGEQNTLRNYCTITFSFAERVEKERGEARGSPLRSSPLPIGKKQHLNKKLICIFCKLKKVMECGVSLRAISR